MLYGNQEIDSTVISKETFTLTVVIPVYNERDTIQATIKAVMATPYSKEIIIVDDCSTDGTRNILKKLNDPVIKVLYHDRNMGKGAALRTGFARATGDIVIIQDADLEYDPDEYSIVLMPNLIGKAGRGVRVSFCRPRRTPCSLLLALCRQPLADPCFKSVYKPELGGHGNVL